MSIFQCIRNYGNRPPFLHSLPRTSWCLSEYGNTQTRRNVCVFLFNLIRIPKTSTSLLKFTHRMLLFLFSYSKFVAPSALTAPWVVNCCRLHPTTLIRYQVDSVVLCWMLEAPACVEGFVAWNCGYLRDSTSNSSHQSNLRIEIITSKIIWKMKRDRFLIHPQFFMFLMVCSLLIDRYSLILIV